jgi:hypothetical protein
MGHQPRQPAENVPHAFVIPSEARNLLLIVARAEKQIPRFVRNDKMSCFFRTL